MKRRVHGSGLTVDSSPLSEAGLPYRRLAAAVLVAAWEDATHRCTPRCFAEEHARRRHQAREFLRGTGMFADSLQLWTELLDVHPDFLRAQLARAQNGRRPQPLLAPEAPQDLDAEA